MRFTHFRFRYLIRCPPPKLVAFALLFDAQPALARDAFNYFSCLLMAKIGKRLIGQQQ
jgi:hypothetical protein